MNLNAIERNKGEIFMRRKIVVVVGLFAILLGINMQANALSPADWARGGIDRALPPGGWNIWKLEVKDSTIHVGDRWNPEDNFVSAYDEYGSPIDFSEIKVEGANFSTDRPGIHEVSYMYQNRLGAGLVSGATVTVLADQTSIEVKNSTLYAGDQWNPKDNFVRATDGDGKAIDFKDITVDGNVDVTKEDVYKVKYSIIKSGKARVTKEATITVKGNDLTSLEVKDSILYFGDKWQAEDNLVKAIDKDGNDVGIKGVTVDGKVDTSKKGINKIKYTILNHKSEKINKEATITVKGEDLTSIETKNSTLYIGDYWNQEDNLVKATNKDGEVAKIGEDVMVDGLVNTTKEGSYKVTYSIYNAKQEKISKEVTVTVKKDQTTLRVDHSSLHVGDTWNPADNIIEAIDPDGKAIDIKDILIEGSVDTSKEEQYLVKFSIFNHKKEKITKEARVFVSANLTDLEVKDSTLYLGDTWKPEDNLVKATDADGNPVGIDKITVEGSVDTNKEGTYDVMYSINTGQAGANRHAKITVKADETNLEVKNSTLYLNDKWNPENNIVKAVDKDGKKVDIKNVTVEGSVDTSKEGISTIKYTIINHKNEKISKDATITVKEDKTSIEVKDSQLFVTDKWNKADNFISATDKDGKTLTIEDVTIDGNVDTSKEGTYEVTYSVLNHAKAKVSKKAKIYVYADQTTLEVKDTTLYKGDTWKPEDNVVRAFDKNGKEINIKDITVEGSVDPATEGTYKVTYTILNYLEEKISKVATITVKGNDLTELEVKDTTLYAGDTWKPADNIVKANDMDGKAIDIKDITVEGNVDVAKEGVYKVKYTIANHKNEKISKEATITVKGNDLTSIEVKNSILYVGQKWNPADNLVKAIDKDGKNVGIDGVTYEGEVKTDKAGTYKVEFAILNHKQEKIKATASVFVTADLTTLEVKDSTLYIGDTWKPEDNFVSATDKDGKPVGIEGVDVKGDVNTAKAGTYNVTYEISNSTGTKVVREALITIKADETTLEVKGSVLYLNEEWNPQDNIVKALDKDGNKIDIKDIVIDGEVNTNVANDYNVKFTIFNHKKEPVVRATIVKVKEDLTSLEVKDSVLYFGDRWQPEDNLVKATDKDGNPLDIYDIDVKGDVDIKTAGDYPVEYTIYNNAKEKITKVATITMKGHDYTYLEVDDSTLYVGDKWNPADNLIAARDKDGNELGIEDVTVEGDVDTSKAGTYEVVYSLLNHNNDKLSNIATITVKEDQTSLKVKNTTIYLNDQWNPADNFVSATNKDGKDIALKDVVVESNVDTSKTGICKVKYTILDHKGENVTKIATVIVKEDLTNIEVKDSTLYLSDTWNPEDNIVKAVDKDGKVIKIKNITVDGKVDTAQVGIYQVTYTILNHRKEKVSALANIKVKKDQTSLIVKDSELYRDDEWNPADNIVEAIDKDGNVIEDIAVIAPQDDENENKAKVIVEGSVDTRNEGISKLTYTIYDHANTKITKEVSVNTKLDKASLQVKDTIIRLNSKWKPADNLVRAINQDGKTLKIKDVKVEGKVNTRKAGKYKVTYTIMNHADKKISKKATVTVQKKNNGNGDGNGNGNGSGSGKDGNGNLPKTGYDMSIIGSLLGLAGVLGFGSLYLNRRERKE